MFFTILYIVMSVNRFDTKLWLLLNSLLDFFVQLKERMCKYLNLFKVFGLSCLQEKFETKYIIMIYIYISIYIVIYVTLANLTEQTLGDVSDCILVEMLHQTYHFINCIT